MSKLAVQLAIIAIVLAGTVLGDTSAHRVNATATVADAATGIGVASAPGAATAVATTARPFAATSPFNVPIVRTPAVDRRSAAMVARVSRAGLGYANLVEFGIPVYEATASTPRRPVRCTRSDWGVCPLAASPRPIPSNARPSVGSDGAMVVIDRASGRIDEYWQARRSGDGWTASFGAVNSLSGSGWGGGSTGAGASRLAGVVRVAEIRAGVIPHALVLQSDSVCATTFRPPALKTDGLSTRADCIPEGSRVQLNPAINVSAIPGITPGERAVARALQVYGGYLIDRGGAPLSVSFEVAPDAGPTTTGAVYARAGFAWDYHGMPHVPWRQLRVLQAWNR